MRERKSGTGNVEEKRDVRHQRRERRTDAGDGGGDGGCGLQRWWGGSDNRRGVRGSMER